MCEYKEMKAGILVSIHISIKYHLSKYLAQGENIVVSGQKKSVGKFINDLQAFDIKYRKG